MKISARSVAYDVLQRVEEESAYVNLALQQAFRRVNLDPRDKSLCTNLVYGTVQRRRSLDVLIRRKIRRPLAELDSRVLTLLRLTVYQLGFLHHIPTYAAVDEAVRLAKEVQPRAAGFVNGVLRAFTRDTDTPEVQLLEIAADQKTWADAMGVRHSYPTWLVRAWEVEFGRDRAEHIMAACNAPAHMSLRVNLAKGSREDALAALRRQRGDDVAELSPVSPYGIRVLKGFDIESWDAYKQGWVTVQDEAAMLVSPLVRPNDHPAVLDMCAAPGTKTTHLGELQTSPGTVYAVDIHQHKLELIERSRERLGLNHIAVLRHDARLLGQVEGYPEKYDAVLLDAPCSGLGVLTHRPDIRWKRTPEDVKNLRKMQSELLIAAEQLVRPGGIIVYSTCTLLADENQNVVAEAVQRAGSTLVWDEIRHDLPVSIASRMSDDDNGLLLTPEWYGTDGFYMARLKKRMKG